MKRHVLNIDDGGITTQALIVDEEGQVKGWGIGPSNYDDAGTEKAKGSMEEAVQAALAISLPHHSATAWLSCVLALPFSSRLD